MKKQPGIKPNRYLILAVILTAPFLVVLGAFTFNIAAPSIQHSLDANNAELQMMFASYILSYAVFLITAGRLGDLYGRRLMFVVGMLLFSLSSLLVALSPSAVFFIGVRILQGLGAALMYPQTLSLIQVNFEGARRTFALSMFGITLGLAAVLAQVLGGIIIQENIFHLLWRPVFLLNVPIGLLACLIAVLAIPESRADSKTRLDLGGVGLVMLALTSFILPLIIGRQLGWPWWSWALLTASLFAAFFLLKYERYLTSRGASPLLELRLFQLPSFVLGLLLTLFFYAGQVSFFFILTLYLQNGLGYSPLQAGLIFCPLAIGFFFASLLSPRLLARLGNNTLVLGSNVLALGTLTLTLLTMSDQARSFLWFLPPLLFIGVGFGMIIPPLIGIVLKTVPSNYAGSVSGVLITAQQVAGSIGVAVIGIIFFGLLGSSSHPHYGRSFGFTLCFNAGLFVLTGILAQSLKEETSQIVAAK